MVSLSNTDLRSMDSGLGGFSSNLENSLQSELELLLQARRNRQVNDQEKELNIYRYGSAPPTVEGSLSAVGGLFQESSSRDGHIWTNSDNNAITCEDEIRSHPAYLQYYYSHGNVNPRLPPPALSKEDWRVAQRFQAGGSSYGGIRDLRKNVIVEDDNGSSLFSMQPGGPRLSTEKAENDLMELRMANRQASPQWPERAVDRLSGLPSPGLGTRRKSFADIVQEGVNGSAPSLDQPSRPQSQNALADMVGRIGSSDAHIMGLSRERTESMEALLSGTSSASFPRIPSPGIINSHASATIGSSLSRNRTPEPQFTGRPPSSGSPLVDSRGLPKERKNAIGSNIQNGLSLGMTGIDDVAASLSGLSFYENRHSSERNLQQSQQLDFASAMLNGHSRSMQQLINESNSKNLAGSSNLARKTRHLSDLGALETHTMGQVNFPRRTASSANLHSKMNSSSYENLKAYDSHNQGAEIPNMDFSSHLLAGMSGERKLSSNMNSYLAGSAFTGNAINPELLDPAYVQYLQRNSDLAAQAIAVNNLSHLRDQYLGGDYDLQKAYAEASLARQQQYGRNLGNSLPNQRNQGNLKHGIPLQYPGYTRANLGIPSVGYGNAVLHDEQIAHFASMMRSPSEASIGPWSSNSSLNPEGKYTSSLLDEFKNNKTRLFELSDIYDHVVEFSTDQYGSRFIQQKLETATEEEKNQLFPEILPHARSLMTDVFGNYVIQKFFEHGTASQRKELANQLTGYVLPLSLQMYGCRVIQKALEVVDVEQKTQMVAELDGSVKKCVRDQNGNHVIQKCIECVPQSQIQFIISSFYGQVASLSMHPYGCRVIQRVLEYCDDPRTQEIMMDEIMQSVNSLAQDQYGNYVIQHVLEHGKPHERSAIVSMLSGQIVRMSQQKYASNVVEKCLTFGTPEERQLLIQEIIGFTDENEPLQAMMRDPFGNYVVQKVLETCDNRSLEYILSRIRVHLNTLKRYTYGKHIVSRVEKLIATGEQRMVMSSTLSSGGN